MRIKRVRMYGDFVVRLMTMDRETHCKCIKGLPEGCRFLYCIPSQYLAIEMVIEHSSFEEVKDHEEIPELNFHPEFNKLYCREEENEMSTLLK
jgi:hypothetical protein